MELKYTFDSKIVDLAIEKGVEYLWSLQVDGRWKGFPTLAGESDIWVTGFVLAHIYRISRKTNAIRESQDFLLQSRHPSGGWSYSGIVPPDADSTAWCLLALASCKGLTGSELEKARAFLWSHFTGRGVSTYHAESGIREFISAPNDQAIAGWTSAHADVSIAAVLADFHHGKVPEVISWLISQQTNAGFINAYWWRSPQYTTTLLLRTLSGYQHRLPTERTKLIAGALVREQLAGGGYGLGSSTCPDPFTTSLALESFAHLSYHGQYRERTRCGHTLLHMQKENGNWVGDFILRIPAPDMIDPNQVAAWTSSNGGGNSFINDKDGLFATAMACYALACWRQTETQDLSLYEWPRFSIGKESAAF